MAATQDNDEWQFPRFNELPVELREMIWRACLPHRFRELDQFQITCSREAKDNCRYQRFNGCPLWHTTALNSRPPTITRVCSESRKVALQTGSLRTWDEGARLTWIENAPPLEWIDPKRSSPHISYDIVAEEWDVVLERASVKDAIGRLADAVDTSTAPGVFPLQLLTGNSLTYFWATSDRPNAHDLPITGPPRRVPLDPETYLPMTGSIDVQPQRSNFPTQEYTFQENPEKYTALIRHPEWLVVMETVFLHCVAKAIATGLFGVYGDAPIQVIKTSEQHKINLLFDLLEEDDQRVDVDDVQKYERRTHEDWQRRLRSCIWAQQYPDDLAGRLCPAITFTLCYQDCNQARYGPLSEDEIKWFLFHVAKRDAPHKPTDFSVTSLF